MKKLIFVFGLFMLFINSVYAQQVIFQKTYGDSLAQEAYDVKRTLDGRYVQLLGVSGRIVDEQSQVAGVTSFDCTNFDKGIYFIRSIGRLEKNIEKVVLY